MTLYVPTPRNLAARVGLALSGVNALVSLVWWFQHRWDWVFAGDLLTFPGGWQSAVPMLVLAAFSGVFLWRAWVNASHGYEDGAIAPVLGGVLLTVIALVPVLIQILRALTWVLMVVVGIIVLISIFGGRRGR